MKQFNGYGRKEDSDFMLLPKGAYVIKFLDVKEESNKSGTGSHLKIAFDIAEGEFAGFYKKMFDNSTKEDKKWSADAYFFVTCPEDNSEQYVIDNFNKFMTAVEDSNNGYHWNWDESTLKGKVVGAKFCNEQSEYNGNVYDHTKCKWFTTAQKVRDGKFGQLPKDKLIAAGNASGNADFMKVADIPEEEIPF